MENFKLNKIVAILLSVLIIFTIVFVLNQTAYAEGQNEFINDDWETSRTLLNSKSITGLDGEELICFEYAPVGYAIYDINGELWERSKDALSPYTNIDKELLYGGPQNYYEFNEQNQEITNIYSRNRNKISNTLYKVIKQKSNRRIIENREDLHLRILNKNLRYLEQCSVDGVLANVRTTELNKTGTCGGVAAALVLNFYDQKYPDKNINSDNDITSLYNKLADTGNLNNSTADTIKPVVKKYLANNGGDCFNHKTLLGLFTTNKVLSDSITNKNPVMLFSQVEDPSEEGSQSISHVIVAHGYYKNLEGYTYICHFGWSPAYNNVEVKNAIKYITVGQSYRMEIK